MDKAIVMKTFNDSCISQRRTFVLFVREHYFAMICNIYRNLLHWQAIPVTPFSISSFSFACGIVRQMQGLFILQPGHHNLSYLTMFSLIPWTWIHTLQCFLQKPCLKCPLTPQFLPEIPVWRCSSAHCRLIFTLSWDIPNDAYFTVFCLCISDSVLYPSE